MYIDVPYEYGNGTTDTSATAAVADIFTVDVRIPMEVFAVGAIITTVFAGMTTVPIISLITSAADRSTLTTQAAVTIPNLAAVGNSYHNRLSTPVRLNPGMFFKVRITTAGLVGTGNFRPYVWCRYTPTADAAMTAQTIVTA